MDFYTFNGILKTFSVARLFNKNSLVGCGAAKRAMTTKLSIADAGRHSIYLAHEWILMNTHHFDITVFVIKYEERGSDSSER